MKDQRGQALLEVLIGTTILAIVIVGLLSGMQAGIWGTIRVDERTTALNLVQSQMEYVKAQDYRVYPDPGEPYDEIDVDPPYSMTVTVTNVPDYDPTVLQQITVTVSYDGRNVVLEDYKGNW